MPLSENGLTILRLISRQIDDGRFDANDPQTFLGYREVHTLLDVDMQGPTWGESFLNIGGLDLAQWTLENNYPAITGLLTPALRMNPLQV